MKGNVKTKDACIGCVDDFYNGKNPYGIQQCWNFKNAQLENKIQIPIDMRPPYDCLKAVKKLNCFRQKGFVLQTVKP